MSANVGTVTFALRAATDQLGADIRKGMSLANRRLGAAGRIFGRTLAASLSTATAALTASVVSATRSIDQLAKTSDKLGISTEKLQLLRHAADLTGVATQQLDTGLQRMTRRVAEAAQGTGEAVNALRELRLDAQELVRLSPDQIFQRIGEAMGDVSNQSDRVRLAMKLFDSEGVGLVNTLKLTREQLDGMQKDLDRFGVTVSREGAARIEAMNDQFTVLGGSFTGLANQIAVGLAPALQVLARDLTATNQALIPLIVSFGTWMTEVIVPIYDELGSLFIRFKQVQAIIIETQVAIDRFFAEKVRGGGLGKDIAELEARARALRQEIEIYFRDTGGNIFANSIKRTAAEIRSTFSAINNEINLTRETIVTAAQVATEEWMSFAMNATSAIDEFVETGRFSIKNFVRDVLQDLAKIQLRKMLFGNDMTSGLLGSVFGGIGKAVGLPISTTPGKALGGRVSAGQPSIVGERGMETFVPDVSGTIMPHVDTQRMLNKSGGATFVFSPNIQAGVTRQELAIAMQQAQEQFQRSVLQGARNGGVFGATLAGGG